MSNQGDGTDEDALWRSIVANYGERATLGTDESPDATEPSTDEQPRERAEAPAAPAPVSPEEADAPAPIDPWVERHLAEEHYTPPEPPRTPLPEPPRLLAWSGVLGVPVLLLVLVVLGIAIPSWGSLLMTVWFLGGFGYLVATMRRDDDEDGGDDGAVV